MPLRTLIEQNITIAMLALIVLLGSIAHATAQWKLARDRKDETFSRIDYLILFIIALFAGVMFGLVGSLFFEDPRMIGALSGAGAFLGVQGLNKLTETVLSVLVERLKK